MVGRNPWCEGFSPSPSKIRECTRGRKNAQQLAFYSQDLALAHVENYLYYILELYIGSVEGPSAAERFDQELGSKSKVDQEQEASRSLDEL